MLVILKENIDKLGRIGDVVKVSDGYARNFLLPQRLVIEAEEHNIAQIEHYKKALEKKRLAAKASADELAQKLNAQQLTFTRKVGKNDKLFGSVTASDISDELAKVGFLVDKASVQMKEALKSLGVHSVSVRLQPDVTATVKVWIVKEGEATA